MPAIINSDIESAIRRACYVREYLNLTGTQKHPTTSFYTNGIHRSLEWTRGACAWDIDESKRWFESRGSKAVVLAASRGVIFNILRPMEYTDEAVKAESPDRILFKGEMGCLHGVRIVVSDILPYFVCMGVRVEGLMMGTTPDSFDYLAWARRYEGPEELNLGK